MLGAIQKLRRAGVMGINARNGDYTGLYNPRRLYPLVDDKLTTKRLAQKAGIAVPELYGVIEIQAEVRRIHEITASHREFVIKPAQGSGGEGVTVISGRSKDMYRSISGYILSRPELEHHVSNILGGMYSLGGHPDKALIEYCVRFDPVFEAVSYLGVPDIRIIVFMGVPVMSMVRLPTRMSDGKANLHQGAIGAGIDMRRGETIAAVWRNSPIEEHPDTGNSVIGLRIPGWDDLLNLAARCYELTGLGYQGVDIVLDRDLGPLILELNARPGLNIQIANHQGLLPRLEAVKGAQPRLKALEQRLDFARSFGQ